MSSLSQRAILKRKEFALGGQIHSFNPFALRKAKIAYNFGQSECNRVKSSPIGESSSTKEEILFN